MAYDYFKQLVLNNKKLKKALFSKNIEEDDIKRAYALYIDCNTPDEQKQVDYEMLND